LAIDVYKEWLGIPEGPRPPDHYQLLRLVEFEDAADKIRGNYKKLNAHVRKYATGQYSVESQVLLNELARAMLCLTDAERKREYDQSLGREFEEERSATGGKLMENLLIEQGHISHSQLKEARTYADKSGLDLRDALVQLKMVEPALAAQALAGEVGLPYIDLAEMTPEDAALDKVPRKLVKQHSILPLFIDDVAVLVACVHPIDHDVEDELRLRFARPIRSVLATPFSINQGIAKYYAPGLRDEPVEEVVPSKASKTKKQAEAPRKKSSEPKAPVDKRQQQQIGIIVFCWSFVLAYLLDWMVITPNVFGDMWSYLLFLVIPGITGIIVWQMYWKK
jgi:hypothetical protein